MLSEDDLRQTFATAAAHLTPGGIFITAPDYFREGFRSPMVSDDTHKSADGRTELTHIEYAYDPDPDDTTAEALFIYVIREDGDLRIEHDHHTWGLFPLRTWLDLLDEAGFDVEKWPYPVHDDGHEAYLLVGTLRS
jgi:hypothetical protein